MKYERSRDEVVMEFREQIEALEASAANYDAGKLWEAKRMATAVWLLVHDGGRQHSVLKQLGVRTRTPFVSSAKPFSGLNEDGGTFWSGFDYNLCGMRLQTTSEEPGADIQWFPACQGTSPPATKEVRFLDWWEEEPIYRNLLRPEQGQNSPVSYVKRKNLVAHLRNKEGGAHYDPELSDADYMKMRGSDHNGVVFTSDGGAKPVPVKNGHLATMRQIAWEVLKTCEKVDTSA